MKLVCQIILYSILIQNLLCYQVIVVGAGVSGLTAAQKLAQAGHNVTILEGRNRTCGRIWTNRAAFGSDVVGTEADLGAGWIHGSSDSNPITQLFTNASLNNFVQTKDDLVVIYDSNGAKVSSSASDAAYNSYTAAMSEANTYASQNAATVGADVSLGSRLKANAGWNDELFRYSVSSSIEFDTSGDIDKLGLLRNNEDSRIKGVENLIRYGYDQICDKILAKDLQNNIKLNVNVVKVTDNGSNGVEVTDYNGNIYKATSVIVTVPLGSLQRGQITFSPALPAAKQAAINRIGYGNVNKLVLEFPNQFWSNDYTYIGKAVTNQAQRGLWTYFLNAAGITKKPTLISIAIGQNAYDVETISQTESVNAALKNLNTIYGSANVGTPNRTVQSKWGQDYFAGFGTYSYGKVGQLEGDHDVAAATVGNIYFAGEHTYMKYRGTVHGAYYSGLVAAENVQKDQSHKHTNGVKLLTINAFIILFIGLFLQ